MMTAACWIGFLLCAMLLGVGAITCTFSTTIGLEIMAGAYLAGQAIVFMWFGYICYDARERRR